MKHRAPRPTLALLGGLLLFTLANQPLQAALFEDTFDSYTTGPLANNADWPSSIPGTNDWRWHNGAYGSSAIIDGTIADRSDSKLLHWTLGSTATATTSRRPVHSVAFDQQLIDTVGQQTWELTLDFSVESIVNTSVGLVRLNNADAQRITGVALQARPEGFRLILTHGNDQGGTAFTYSPSLSLDTWYTLTITGNNIGNGSLSYSLSDASGEVYHLAGKSWDKLSAESGAFTELQLGSGNADVSAGSVYIDHIQYDIATIPEGSAAALLSLAALPLASLYLWRRNHAQARSGWLPS